MSDFSKLVEYNGLYSYINVGLAKERGVLDNLDRICTLHRRLLKINHYLEHNISENIVKRSVKLTEEIEFLLQDAWEFPRDKSKHSNWLRTPHCTCGYKSRVMNNSTDISKVRNLTCIIHGNVKWD